MTDETKLQSGASDPSIGVQSGDRGAGQGGPLQPVQEGALTDALRTPGIVERLAHLEGRLDAERSPSVDRLVVGMDTLGKLAWPLFALVAVFLVRTPIVKLLETADELAQQTETLGVGEFSFKRRFRSSVGDPRIAGVVSSLNEFEIALLFDDYRGVSWSHDQDDRTRVSSVSIPDAESEAAYRRMAAAGLFEENGSWEGFKKRLSEVGPGVWEQESPGRARYRFDTAITEEALERDGLPGWRRSTDGQIAVKQIQRFVARELGSADAGEADGDNRRGQD